MTGYTVRPVGVLHTAFGTKTDAPIQGAFVPDAAGVLEVFDEYAAGLADIDDFSHLIVLYLLDRADRVDLQPVPFLDDTPHGVFATRHPWRPNHIALSVVRLDKREGNRLFVRNVDALDKSPVLDIKPYVPGFDAVPDAAEGWYADRPNRPKPAGRE